MENMKMQKAMETIITSQKIKQLSCVIALILGNIAISHAAVVPSGTKLAAKQELVRNNGSEPASLDTHKVSSNVEFNIISDFFDGLVSVNKQGKVEPRLAERWETSDNKTWIFHLKKGIKWSDGSPITAHDVVFSWRRLTEPDTVSPYGSYFENAAIVNAGDVLTGKKKPEELGVKALDDFTLEIKLDKPVGDFLQMLGHPVTFPISEKAVNKYGDRWTRVGSFVGSGAYKLSEWVVNEKLVGVRNPQYWDDKNTVINKVTYLPLSSEKADLNRYLAGEIDITFTISVEDFPSLKKSLPDEVKISPKSTVYFYEFNTKKPPFDDARVRKALSLAIDRDIIVDKILGQGQLPAYSMLTPNIGGFDFEQPDYASWTQEQRVAKAKELLNEAGFNKNNLLKFDLLYNTQEGHKKMAIAVSSMWKKNLGVNAALQNQEWKVVLDNMHQGKFDVIRRAWVADYDSPMTFLTLFASKQVNNTSQYENKEFDEFFEKAGVIGSKDYYQKASDILTKDLPSIPVYYYVNHNMVKPYVGGFDINARGEYFTKDLYIIEH
ncbi:oligopeptide ABC transporter substrate-binding protein OppA [Xenorhabdus sp. 42]|uniref:ABC transporter substrate-binding protein n=2 Tax=Xenorhabdus szentirmaii TaxID=290112 RepID=UPI0019898B50|nr:MULTISPECIES: ABC transporter substrate-binding protein [unclassified Xenorhabdus]MBD2790917.1 oligopeptide ABC transporter substrate-binding protein OppA [Xenorhabdus sp. CUL]MBD2803953.1 oligopeptide ABC transporter substrate-binding protein OppA [Xenorhabdus sp. ZM]MBD2820259.1 oligopeptide ABC transporter substrate-binding protein OppA [Xenorhabdus sp. 42]MBD2825137.1 oligopeptide ABC transporter substrate-binding protein OppA [Xenorhabdus sp. 5]